ncbi:MAG: acetyl-CoA carboxylase biotin carboxylase subunit [Chitinophagales bacterium]|nr:MAG: acetyl-CoA carboxylase biotin carboxylase subunit [Chitinophagales bacterium]
MPIVQIRKILVANRGEIALRIMRTARDMGIRTVAIFSDADRLMPYVRFADEAVHIGPSPSAQSYLDAEKIIAAARQVRADAIHPGYGFLSEREDFAAQVQEAGFIFIGPSADAIRMMGNKLEAKRIARKLNIPLLPGTDKPVRDVHTALMESERIGYPVLLKAAAGGGGKGMRVVKNASELPEQLERAMSEAQSSFGDNSVFIEKYIASPRHVEIQVLADAHGNTLYLFERECSIQRRHQKLIEEAPSPVMTETLRARMGESAVALAQACGYVNAGTVEFLLDENLNFYFLEMNTRLQVEHPVTECITGTDLVREQIQIARGEKLSFTQEDLSIHGHAIELRINAEDPYNDFLPNPGRLKVYHCPCGPGVRVDDGYEQGLDIPVYYDPMIAKLITFGKDRDEAIQRMSRAIREYKISGIRTTLEFGKFVMEHPDFIRGQFSTRFIEQCFSAEQLFSENEEEMRAAAVAAALIAKAGRLVVHVDGQQTTGVVHSKWKQNRLGFEV